MEAYGASVRVRGGEGRKERRKGKRRREKRKKELLRPLSTHSGGYTPISGPLL